MLGEAENKANSASIEVDVEVEAELCNIRNKLSWRCHTCRYKLS